MATSKIHLTPAQAARWEQPSERDALRAYARSEAATLGGARDTIELVAPSGAIIERLGARRAP